MRWKLPPRGRIAAALAAAVFSPSGFAQTCGPISMSLTVHESAPYIIYQCPSTPEATFTILDPGSERVASIVLTDVQGSEGTFEVVGVAPGETQFRIRFAGVVPPQRSGECTLSVAVANQ